ncbi:MAG TPA: sigma 54-interacting transcriptional regulator [Edaphobacter sp.]|nr:sigma 54-interacting transcriptional regulator [Edaphobacter sp.]
MSTARYQADRPDRIPYRRSQSGQEDASPASDRDELEMVGDSTAMKRLRLQVRRLGPHFRTVLISGEPGSGKELAARALHGASTAAGGPFVTCAASTLESEAEGDGLGGDGTLESLLAQAKRGLLFFDGIDEMPLIAQARLLQVMRQHEWARDGLAAPQKMDMRIVASTSEDLRVLASTGQFRQELYQRIAMVEIALPPLRERMEDIPALAQHFLRRFGRMYERSAERIAEDAMELLKLYRWPGNVRELENVLRNGVLRNEGTALEASDLPQFVETHADAGGVATARLQDVVEQHVLQVLRSCSGNKVRAAEALGISRSTLYRMLEACAPAEELER